jgi:hypothetical protein
VALLALPSAEMNLFWNIKAILTLPTNHHQDYL